VIKNRAKSNRECWGGGSIADVCLKPRQFEYWNGKSDIDIKEKGVYDQIYKLAERVYNADSSEDPTRSADHYNNPDEEGFPSWTENCTQLDKVGNHQFYKEKIPSK
jgi:hypothetical protein